MQPAHVAVMLEASRIAKPRAAFVLVDAWLLFFSKNVNLWQNYVGNKYVDQM